MALLSLEVLGKPTGTIGKYYMRRVNGKTIVSHRPKRYQTPMDSAAILRRNQFAMTVRFAKTVSSLPALKLVWNDAKGKYSSAHHAILHCNYSLVSGDMLTLNNLITPEGFYFVPSDVSFDWEKITVTLPALNGSIKNSDRENVLSLNIIICFQEPREENKSLIDLLAFEREFPDYDFSKEGDTTIELTNSDKETAARYAKSIFYIALVTKETSGKLVQHSSTYSVEIS